MMTIIRDQEWKDVRSSVTPAFTTGKIKRVKITIKMIFCISVELTFLTIRTETRCR